MKLITALVASFSLDEMRDVLTDAGVNGITVSEAKGHGRRGGHTEIYRGSEFTVDLEPRVRVELVVVDRAAVERVINALATAVRSGQMSPGKVWVTDVEWVVSLRTGEMNDGAL